MTDQVKATIAGVAAGALFFPVTVSTVCNGECYQTGQTWWGLDLPGAWAGVTPILVATLTGLVVYRFLRR